MLFHVKHFESTSLIELDNCPLCGSSNHIVYLHTQDYFLSGESFNINECRVCGHLFTNPQPISGHLGKYYKSDRYLSHKENPESLFERIYASVRWLNLRTKYKQVTDGLSGGKLLDYGCGTGDFLAVASAQEWECYGIEQDENARKIAEKKNNVTVFSTNAPMDNFQNQFDLITMFHVLEHIPDLHSIMNNLKSWLNDSGRLAVALPNPRSYDALHYGQYWAAWDVPRHLHHFKKETIIGLAEQYGFQLKTVHAMYWDAFFVSLLSEEYKKSKLRLAKSGAIGLLSNLNAMRTKQFSSLLYLFSKAD